MFDTAFFEKLLMIVEMNPQGFTINIEDLEMVTKGIAVAYEETQHSFGRDGLLKCLQHAVDHEKLIGGWRNPAGGFQFDSIRIFKTETLKPAIKFGRCQKQYSIYDLDNHWEIVL